LLEDKVLGITTQADSFFSKLNLSGIDRNPAFIALDIIVVALIFYWILVLFKETRGIRIIYGIILLIGLNLLGRYFQLSAFNFVLRYLSTMIIVAIPIVLQPELRAALERLGRTPLVADVAKMKKREIDNLLDQITETVQILAKNKIGALIAFGRSTGLREFTETGTNINGHVSTELLLTIFSHNTALHDGAVIIIGNHLAAAGCTLPLTDAKMSFSLGTRHRAALGLASQTDAIVVVVSEERGQVSLAMDGKLHQDLPIEDLRVILYNELNRLRSSIGAKQ
jgi:diadenylate cyclase